MRRYRIRVPTALTSSVPEKAPTDHDRRSRPETVSVYEDKRDDGKRLAIVNIYNDLHHHQWTELKISTGRVRKFVQKSTMNRTRQKGNKEKWNYNEATFMPSIISATIPNCVLLHAWRDYSIESPEQHISLRRPATLHKTITGSLTPPTIVSYGHSYLSLLNARHVSTNCKSTWSITQEKIDSNHKHVRLRQAYSRLHTQANRELYYHCITDRLNEGSIIARHKNAWQSPNTVTFTVNTWIQSTCYNLSLRLNFIQEIPMGRETVPCTCLLLTLLK